MNIAQILERSRRLFPDKPALIFEGQSITYRELDEMSNRVANTLSGLGIARGDRVALFLPNIPEFVGAYFGIQKIGAIAVCVNSALKSEETRFILDDSDATALVTTEALRGNVPAEKLPQLRHILIAAEVVGETVERTFESAEQRAGKPAPQGSPDCAGEAKADLALSELMASASPTARAVDMAPNDPAAILYTTATTGFPKGATLSHNNVVSNVRVCTYTLRLHPDDRILLFLPAFYNFGQNAVFLPCFDAGATLVLHRKYSSAEIIRSVGENRVSVFFGVPTIYAILYDKATAEQMRSVRCYVSAAAPLPRAIADQWRDKFGLVINNWYGMTEGSAVSFNHFLKYKPGAIGTPFEGIEMQVVDAEGRAVETGQVGEIVVRGPNVMLGFWNRPAETRQVIKDGWFHTGDLARMDDDGYFYFEGYLKEMVNVAGEKAYPAEIERVLREHPAVADVAVYGVPDAVMGEQVRASIVGKPGAQVSAEEITAFCNARMVEFKVPKGFEFVDALPKSESVKMLKETLREKFLATLPKREAIERKTVLTEESVRNWIVAWLAEKIALNPTAIETNRPFAEYGLTSILAVLLAKDLREWSGRPILPVVAWDYPTADALTRHLVNGRAQAARAEAERGATTLVVEPLKSADLRALSDDELAKLLAAEIDAVKR